MKAPKKRPGISGETASAQMPASEGEADGRRLRSERSRRQIIKALFELIREGHVSPTAHQVAELAGVSLRTVFRHFEDRDSLNREMTAEIETEIMPIVLRPFETTAWRDRVFELADRRIEIYEHIMPLKLAASLRRFESDFLMDDYNRFLTMERASLKAILPDAMQNDPVLFAALEMVSSFDAWRRLRLDQDLEPDVARQVIHMTLTRLIDGGGSQ